MQHANVMFATPRSANSIEHLVWPAERLAEGMEALARAARLSPARCEPLPVPAAVADSAAERVRWMDWAAARLGIEVESVETSMTEFESMALRAGPAIFAVQAGAGAGFVLVLRSSGRGLRVLAPDSRVHRCPVAWLREAKCARLEAPFAVEIDRLLSFSDLPKSDWPRVRAAMLRERLGAVRMDECWILRLAVTTPFWRQLVHAGVPQRLGWMLALFAGIYALELSGWRLIGEAALGGRLDLGWLSAWALVVLSMVPLAAFAGWLNASFGLDAGAILKRRLLAGALNLDLETVRRQGVGQLLSRVMESQALESLALNGGLAVIVAALELSFAAWVLWMGAGGWLHLGLLVGWLSITLWISRRYIRRMAAWTRIRLDLTHGLIECMVGHRTRLAQEWPARRDGQEDRAAAHYLEASGAMDRAGVAVSAGIPGGWALIGLLGLAPAFVAGSATPAQLAIGFGGLILAHRAFAGIASGLTALAGAAIAWRQVAPMFHAGAQSQRSVVYLPAIATAPAGVSSAKAMTFARVPGASELVAPVTSAARPPLIDAANLAFRHHARAAPVLNAVDLSIEVGERVLLEGASGSGKSTLASLLIGLRESATGLLLFNGLDRHTLGNDWHRLATEAPQFHDNHILSGTLAFNLLMGRNWPASDADIEMARQLCVELDLGDLIERMPSGMHQMVGETGWQLSHGERSRIFLARALLQEAQFTVMDESFAALDPETLQRCLACAIHRAHTLMVIAHP